MTTPFVGAWLLWISPMLKRLFDAIAASLGLMILAPLLAMVALAVRRYSPGPVFFRQVRVGREGHDFVLCKFRTMAEGQKTGGRKQGTGKADLGSRTSDLGLPTSEDGATFDAGSTLRVTPIGSILRRWKLDELPQLWNVLKGDMSLVGPRPEVRKWVDAYPGRWAKVLTIRPGITDPASIEFRNEEELLAAAPCPEDYYRHVVLPRKLELYEAYVRTRCFWGDVGILFRTVWAVVRGNRRQGTEDREQKEEKNGGTKC